MDQTTEAGLLQAMAAAKSLEEQEALAARLEALRLDKHATDQARTESMWVQDTYAVAPPVPHRAAYSRSTQDSDWLDKVAVANGDVREAETAMRAEASAWYSHLPQALKEHPDEVLIQAAGLSDIRASQYGAASLRAQAAFLDQIKHHAETEGLPIPDPASIRPEPYEHGQHSDDTQTDASDTPSLAEGDQPASDTAPSSGSTQENLDAATWPSAEWANADEPPGKEASRKHASQTCSVCGDPIAHDPADEDPSTYHHTNGEKHDHEAKPGETKESSFRSVTARTASSVGEMRALVGRPSNELEPDEVPADYEVQPLTTNEEVRAAVEPAICGTCGLIWDDGKSTGITPTPSGRCPFEYFHWDDSERFASRKTSKAKESSRRTASISLKNVGVEGPGVGVGTDSSGNRVRFRITPKEEADLKAILYSDLAMNFSGVDIEESDVIEGTTASRKTASKVKCSRCDKDATWRVSEFGTTNADPAPKRESAGTVYFCDEHHPETSGGTHTTEGFEKKSSLTRTADCGYCGSDKHTFEEGHPGEAARLRDTGDNGGAQWEEENASNRRKASLSSVASKIKVGQQDKPALDVLARMKSVDDTFEGISGRQVVAHLLAVGEMDSEVRRTLQASLRPRTASGWVHDPAQMMDVGVGSYPGDRWTLSKGEASALVYEVDPAAGTVPYRWTVDRSKTDTTVESGSAQSLEEAKSAAEAALAKVTKEKTASRRTAAQFGSYAELEQHVHSLMALWPDLVAAAEAAYERGDQEWFNSQSTETLQNLWEIAASGFFVSWDDEVYEALALRPGGFDKVMSSRKVAAAGRPIHELAAMVESDWKNVYFGARPYLDAMHMLNGPDDYYGADDARMIVTYFLSNARNWTGPVAREVKKELKALTR